MALHTNPTHAESATRTPSRLAVTRYTPYADLPENLTVKEAIAWTGVGRSAMYDLLRGGFPHLKLGKRILVPKVHLLGGRE